MNNFNPRTPRGVRPKCVNCFYGIKYFNPRTPRGVRRCRQVVCRHCFDISIHAPRGGCDEGGMKQVAAGIGISIHAPRGGCDLRLPQGACGDEGISIHAPRGGCDSKTVHFLAHFADIRRKKSHIFRKTKRRFIPIGRKCCFLTLFRVRTSREIPVRLHFAAYTRSVSVGK